MLASTAMAARRRENAEVEEFLRELYDGPDDVVTALQEELPRQQAR
jgi:hypothetical protein